MILAVIAGYAACALFFTPRLLPLFSEAENWVGRLAIALFIFQIHVFWIYGIFLVVQAVFSWAARIRRPVPPPPLTGSPPVAILYTTLHDFQEAAVLSCIHQDYPACHTFILDDSKREDAKAEVDAFASRYPDQVTVIRRPDRAGHKAGNINNALRHHVHGYAYFAIADADSIFPPSFIRDLLPHFGGDDSVGFVQGAFKPDPRPKSRFSRDLGLQIHSMWKVYAPARNRYGSVIFLGHGGIVRYDVWKAIGGFPTLISEDLALSHRARRLGYRGRFVPEVFSYEEFPESYGAFRKQQRRYVQGICQYIHHDLWRYLTSRHVPWFEKADSLLTCGGLLMPFFFLGFVVLYSIVMPFQFGVRNLFSVPVGETEILVPVFLLSERFFDLGLSWDYLAVTALCTLAPTLGGFLLTLRYPWRGLRTVWLAAAPYMSLLVMSSVAVISYAIFQNAQFTATGERGGPSPQPKLQLRARAKGLISEDTVTAILEVSLGLTLVVMCALTLNVVLLAFGLAILLAPLLRSIRWDRRLLRPLLYLPFLALLGGLVLGVSEVLSQAAGVSIFAWMNDLR